MTECSRTGAQAQAGDGGVRAEIPVWLAFVFLFVTALSWAGSSVAGRAASGQVPPYALSFIRWLAAFMIFLPIGAPALWRHRRILFRNFPLMCAFSLFGVVGFTVPYYVGLQFTPAVNATLMNASGPIMILVLAFLMAGSRVSLAQATGIVFAVAGTVTIVFRGEVMSVMDVEVNVGDALVLSSFFSWALYTVMLKWRPDGMNQTAFLTALCGIASVMMLPMYLWEVEQGRTFALSRGNLIIIAYAALFPSVVAYVCWNLAINRLGANRASFTQYLIPVFGVVLAVLILGEEVAWFHVIGIGCIFAGIYLASAARRAETGAAGPATKQKAAQ